MQECTFNLPDEASTLAFAAQLARLISMPLLTVHLEGDLGAGKTTLSRGIIQALGHQGSVKSPTYTLVEPYQLKDITIYHFDLYRLAAAEELEMMGIRDYFSPDKAKTILCLIEWPSQGKGVLPSPDVIIQLKTPEDRTATGQRLINFRAISETGQSILAALKKTIYFD